ncbi:MAG: ribonuclease Z [Crocinitomicaceae bacterium]|nr:ribonuclease Z [Crocinitomicaceae bacterium]
MRKFELTILGCGAAAPTPYFLTTSQLVNIHGQLILIDCGEGTQLTLRQTKAKFQKINIILISHMHADHTMGLPGLIATMSLLGRRTSLNIWGPKELEEFVRRTWYLTGTHVDFEVKFHVNSSIGPNVVVDSESFMITSFPTKHRVPTCGFVIEEKEGVLSLKGHARKDYNLSHLDIQILKRGEDIVKKGEVIPNMFCMEKPPKCRKYAFAADTAFSPKVVEAVKGCNLLYHEATFETKDLDIAKKTLHSTSSDAARVAKDAGVNQLLIGHFSNRYRDLSQLFLEATEVFTNTSIAKENKTYLIE